MAFLTTRAARPQPPVTESASLWESYAVLGQRDVPRFFDRFDSQVVATRDEGGPGHEDVVGTGHGKVDAATQPLAGQELPRRRGRGGRHQQKLGARRHRLQQPRAPVGQVVVEMDLVDDEEGRLGQVEQAIRKERSRDWRGRERLHREHRERHVFAIVADAEAIDLCGTLELFDAHNGGLDPPLQLANGRVDNLPLGDPDDPLYAMVGRRGQVLERVQHARDRFAEADLERQELALRAIRRVVAVDHLRHQVLLKPKRVHWLAVAIDCIV